MHEEMNKSTKELHIRNNAYTPNFGKLEYRLVAHFVEHYCTPLHCGYGRYNLVLSSELCLSLWIWTFLMAIAFAYYSLAEQKTSQDVCCCRMTEKNCKRFSAFSVCEGIHHLLIMCHHAQRNGQHVLCNQEGRLRHVWWEALSHVSIKQKSLKFECWKGLYFHLWHLALILHR